MPPARNPKPEIPDQRRFYADIFTNVPIAINVFRLEDPADLSTFRIVDANPITAEFLGVELKDLIGKTFADFPRFLETSLPRQYAEVIRSGKARQLGEIRYGDATIREGVYTVRAFPLGADSVGIAFENVTELSQAEQALRESEQRYRSWFENAPLPMWVYDIDDLSFLTVNDAAIRKYGYSRQEFLAMTIKDIRPDVEIPHLLAMMAAPEHDSTRISMVKHRTKDGTTLLVEVYSQLGSWAGKRAKLVQVRDVTELSRARAKLEERTAFLDALIAHSPVAVLVLNAEQRVTLCNPAFEHLFGYRLADIVGTAACQAITPAELNGEALELSRRVSGGETVHSVTRRMRKDGALVDVELYGVPLVVAGKQVGLYWLYQDIRERKEAEGTLREFSARLSRLQEEERRKIARDLHDAIGQSLTALSGNLVAVTGAAEMLPPRERKALSESLSLAQNASREIRTLSYLLYPPMLDEEGLAAALELYLEGFSARSGIRVALEISAEVGRLPQELEATLFRIVQESLTNMHRHSETSVGEIRMTVASGELVLEVADRGKGIAAPILEKIRKDGPGVGVGIAGMRERIRQVGGRLEIESGGRGTTIRALLPLPR